MRHGNLCHQSIEVSKVHLRNHCVQFGLTLDGVLRECFQSYASAKDR